MKKLMLLLSLVSVVQAEDMVPVIKELEKANDISSKTSAPQGSCETCGAEPDSNTSAKIAKTVHSLKANTACLEGKNRLNTDVNYYLAGGTLSDHKIGGDWKEGSLPNGVLSGLYVGESAFKDLMFVTKVTDAGKVVGYNVTISYCSIPSSYQGLPRILSDKRPLKSFQAPNGISLAKANGCDYGIVDLAMNTMINSERDSSDVYSPPTASVPTSFMKPSCAK